MNSVTLVARRRESEWRGALAIDNDFQDTVDAEFLSDLVADNIAPLLDTIEPSQGDRVQITVSIVRAK